MTWVKIDDDMPWNQKVMRASPVGFRVYIGSICYSGQNLTDGLVERAALTLIPHATLKVAKELVALGLWEEWPDGWYVHDYLVHNRSRAQIEAATQAAKTNGQKGLAIRYGKQPEKASEPPSKSLAKTPEKASEPLSELPSEPPSRTRDLHSLGSSYSQEPERERDASSEPPSEPPSEPLDRKIGLPPKTTPTEGWLVEMREQYGPRLRDFDETLEFHMNGSYYRGCRDKCGFLEKKLKAAAEREAAAFAPSKAEPAFDFVN